jgi:hypothetical protein
MSLFESASLVVTPNGAKASKLYAIKPTSGAGDLSVTRATTATRVNSAGLIESVAVNVPRLDYTNGSCPSILVEPQRTNLFLYSEQIDNAIYVKSNVSVTTNSIVSPDGSTTADLCNYTNASNFLIAPAINSINSNYTVSVFAKKGTGNILRIREVFYFGTSTVFNLDLGTVLTGAGKIENYGNGWYRCSITQSYSNIETNIQWSFDSNTNINNLYLWGAQVEAGSYATSYIPTTSASVTRNADVISKTGISSLIGQTEGTMFIDFVAKGGNVNHEILGITLTGGGAEYIALYSLTNGQLYFINNIIGSGILIASSSFNNRYKIAYSYSSGNHKLYVNGSQIYSSTSSSVYSLLNAIYLGASATASGIELLNTNTTAFWKTRLTNAELSELTTL